LHIQLIQQLIQPADIDPDPDAQRVRFHTKALLGRGRWIFG